MRPFKVTLLMLALVVTVPTPAHAWFDWLDNLSGPGPFSGLRFDYTIACFMDQPSIEEAVVATATAKGLTEAIISNSPADFAQLVDRFRKSMDALEPTKRDDAVELSTKAAIIRAEFAKVMTAISAKQKQDSIRQQEPARGTADVAVGTQPAAQNSTQPASQPQLVPPHVPTEADLKAVDVAWHQWEVLLRKAAVHPVSKPSIWLFASCTDRLKGNRDQIQHEDRHPVASLVLNYRELTNATFLHFSAEKARDDSNSEFAQGKPIHLRILEPKIVWPLSGHFDFLDGQAGAGIYWFNSAGFKPGRTTFSGLVVEPIRFDVHAPGRLADGINNANCAAKFGRRLLLSLSYSAGVMLFPRGFAADEFNAVGPRARDISGGEALFEQGFVINVGRLIGR